MDLHGVGGDPRGEQVVLDLLVDEDRHQHPQAGEGLGQQGDEDGQGAGDVGADHRDELGDDPHPKGQGQRERHVQQDEHHPVEQGRDNGQHGAGVDVAARLVHGQVPDLQHHVAPAVVEERAHHPADLGPLRHQVEGEQGHGEDLEDQPEDGGAGVDHVARHPGGQALHVAAGEELLLQLVEVEFGVEGVVGPFLDVVEVARNLLHEVVDLGGQRGADGGGEPGQGGQDHHEHDHGAQAPLDPAPGHPVDRGLYGEGQEQRDHQHDDQRPQRPQGPHPVVDDQAPAPEQQDGPLDQLRHRVDPHGTGPGRGRGAVAAGVGRGRCHRGRP